MLEDILEIKNEHGLHARPSAAFVKLASTFRSTIKISSGRDSVDGKSIMGLMLLAAEKGRRLKVEIDGEDEQEAMISLKKLVEIEQFGEKAKMD